jgi:hypothetical protein
MTEKRYTIGGREFAQPPLVLGQFQKLLELLVGIPVPKSDSALSIVMALGDRLPIILATVLVEPGAGDFSDRDMELEAAFMRDHMEVAVAMEVAEDFFAVNRVSLLLERSGRIREKIAPTASPILSSPLPEATSQNETGPCGT